MTDWTWTDFVAGLHAAGERLDKVAATLTPAEQADGYRALVRALNSFLGRIEGTPQTPELRAFNGWREKFFMDNPDYRYWIAEVNGAHEYRITGNVGDSVYQSITVYSGKGIADASAVSHVDSDDLDVDVDGNFAVTLTPQSSEATPSILLPPNANSIWVRFALPKGNTAEEGTCRIERIGAPATVAEPDAAQLAKELRRLGGAMAHLPDMFAAAVAADLEQPNTVRHWSAMAGGAAFTEPGSRYLRGSWQLGDDEALVLDSAIPNCRHWNIVLYNRFLNSLDYRRSVISRTAATSSCIGDRVRFVISPTDPGVEGYNWLDTQGRPFGLFVLRFLQPASEPELPSVRRVRLDELSAP